MPKPKKRVPWIMGGPEPILADLTAEQRKQIAEGAIDKWIDEHGLDATLKRLITTCGRNRVAAALEPLLADKEEKKRGAAVKRSGEHLIDVYFEVKAVMDKHRLSAKDACKRLVAGKRKQREVLWLFHEGSNGFRTDRAITNANTLYREFKRATQLFQ